MEAYLGQLLLVGFTFAPLGWAFCDGSLLTISQYNALYNLLGTTFGGDGQTTFGLPDLRGRTAIGIGQSTAGSNYVSGQLGGVESVTLNLQQYPPHSHSFNCSSASANSRNVVAGSVLGAGSSVYVPNGTALAAPLSGSACTFSPGGNPHDNRQPYLTMNWIIATEGVYPTP